MAKKKEEPKFRTLRLALSNDAFANLESIADGLKCSKSAVVSNLLDVLDSPLDGMFRVMAIRENKMLRRKMMRKFPPGEPPALQIRRRKGLDK